VSLSLTIETSSMPVAYRLYLLKTWTNDRERRRKTGVPAEMVLQTKAEIAWHRSDERVSQASPKGLCWRMPATGPTPGSERSLRCHTWWVMSTVTAWKPGEKPKPPAAYKGTGRPPRSAHQRRTAHQEPNGETERVAMCHNSSAGRASP
jgi:SRSO17 transposase